ncbi:chimeric ERCC6-PGBD3 protein-like [Eriocheir sinensis]|uniref:chimeric ERCC6-PGBD3 protein-like n=1 Tax=Eriocheir sinensis TaxID=95602 RepID=UPI0021C5965A|nr:chimeric ERCC6-PGBD3 protein-like [Eriocheir sinensis]
MARNPKDILDTTSKIKAVLDGDISHSECDKEEISSTDTDSLESEYLPSADEIEILIAEKGEDEEFFRDLSQSSTADDTATEAGEPSGSQSAVEAFGKIKKRKRAAARSTSSPKRAKAVLPSPATTPVPVLHSTPLPTGDTVDAGEEADVDDVENKSGYKAPRLPRRRLYATPHKDAGRVSSSDDDDLPPRIIFPPRRRVILGDEPPSISGVPRQESRSRSPLSPSQPPATPASLSSTTPPPSSQDVPPPTSSAAPPAPTTVHDRGGDDAGLVCTATNRYNGYRKGGKVDHPRSLYNGFAPVTPDELYVFLAIVILMGTIKKNSIHKYWSTDPLTATPGFNRVMGRNRFQAILGNLHFIDSLLSHTCNQDKPKADKDPMERIRPVSDYLREKIQQGFNPHQKLVIDESLCLWRGNIGIRQYIPSKRHRYGLKTFVMCDCKSGYVQDVLLYMGSKTELEPAPADILIAGAVVCTLMKPYLNEGRILYTDNWYTSPSLCAYLGSVNTGSCGTVRRNRKHLPPLPSAREADSKIYKHANGMLLLSWMDNKEVNVLSTVHEPVQELARRRQRGTGIRLQKPQAINDYNVNMRLVDKKDQVVASAECARKTMRWYKKFFFHLLDLVLYNSNIVYKELTGKVEHREEFCTELARELIIDFKRQPIQRAPLAGYKTQRGQTQ